MRQLTEEIHHPTPRVARFPGNHLSHEMTRPGEQPDDQLSPTPCWTQLRRVEHLEQEWQANGKTSCHPLFLAFKTNYDSRLASKFQISLYWYLVMLLESIWQVGLGNFGRLCMMPELRASDSSSDLSVLHQQFTTVESWQLSTSQAPTATLWSMESSVSSSVFCISKGLLKPCSTYAIHGSMGCIPLHFINALSIYDACIYINILLPR